jgi:hypothetical protein
MHNGNPSSGPGFSPGTMHQGNGCAERFIRTLKENLLWVRSFETIEQLRQALLAFRETYNTTWLICPPMPVRVRPRPRRRRA